MDNASLVRLQSRFLLLGGVVLFTNVVLTFVLCSRRVQLQKDLQIDKERFYYAVESGTSNFLASVTSEPSANEKTSLVDAHVKVHFVPILSTWYAPKSGPACKIDDCVYRVGDYCEYGVVVSISDGRVYVDSGDGVLILRRRNAGSDAPAEQARRDGVAPADRDFDSRAIHE